MHEKTPVNPTPHTTSQSAPRSEAFSIRCDPDGYIVALVPETGEPIEGRCTDLVTEKTADGVRVTQVTMVTSPTRTCVWRKVGGRWVCV